MVSEEGMKLSLEIGVLSTLCFAVTATLAASVLKPNCQEKCGNVTIPYPFGIGQGCSANSSFAVICQNSTNPQKPFLKTMNWEILNISLYGTVIVNLPVSPVSCSDRPRTDSLPISSLRGSPFTVSAHYNTLLVMGCNNSVWLRANETTVGGCTAICDANSTDTSCNGVNCCQTTIPRRLQELEYTYESFSASINGSFCGYVFPADKKWLQNEGFRMHEGLVTVPFGGEFGSAPVVLEWELGNRTNFSASFCKNPQDFHLKYTRYCPSYMEHQCIQHPDGFCSKHPNDYRCQSLIKNYEDEYRYSFYYSVDDYVSSSRYCSCKGGYEGNPYILDGCKDIDECSKGKLNRCESYMNCINTNGSYYCRYRDEYFYPYDGNYGIGGSGSRIRKNVAKAFIVIGSVLGGMILLMATWKSGKAITKVIQVLKASRKYMFFKRNGGLLLEQQLAAIENGIEKIRLFTSTELAKATDIYNENRVVGRGGEGVVYKGMLEDGRIVAVKKPERVIQGDVEAFINEIIIVSQINHRNVVKLLGCCLESEVPRLVYEFIPNGTLFHHIHDPHEDFPLFWGLRVRIAKEVAGALAYLHHAASVPIYHRDIKSTNILLDEKYRAKISDFGTSRSMSIDQTHVTTRVVGTFGYLDPEYFQSSHFTEKSDVYSFGVVLVELLTGEKAISAVRVEEGRGLAMHFLLSMEENHLFDIVDPRVLREGEREDIEAMAEIARRCLHLNGKSRPTMKEVAHHLDAIQLEGEESRFSKNQKENSGCSSVEDEDDSEDCSSMSENMELEDNSTSDA